MKVVIAGGTGFVGRRLVRLLGSAGHEVVVVSRRAEPPPDGASRVVAWKGPWREELETAGAVVNLAGAPVAGGRWTERRKGGIKESRVRSTRALVEAMLRSRTKPAVLVNASAVGYYGDRADERLTEHSSAGTDFLAEVCSAWESEAARAEAAGVRVALLRFGVVLGPEGGALARMLLPFKLGLGGRLGSGRQYMSWIHADDAAGLARFAIEHDKARGPLNAVAPGSVTNADFSRALAAVLGRPCFLSAPAALLRLVFGEMSGVLLASQRVEPAGALALGYEFRFSELVPALRDLLSRPAARAPAQR